MTITRKPRGKAAAADTAQSAAGFIEAAPLAPSVPVLPPAEAETEAPMTDREPVSKPSKKDKKRKDKKKKNKKKEAVLIRFEDGQLERIDAAAETLGLSRAAWVRMVVSKALSRG
ncbi:MAG: hypothetical protein VB101_12800 [Rhodospirillaceae bacterium]|nr:hypothetical protein [Rhodospirillaceae bacterium]